MRLDGQERLGGTHFLPTRPPKMTLDLIDVVGDNLLEDNQRYLSISTFFMEKVNLMHFIITDCGYRRATWLCKKVPGFILDMFIKGAISRYTQTTKFTKAIDYGRDTHCTGFSEAINYGRNDKMQEFSASVCHIDRSLCFLLSFRSSDKMCISIRMHILSGVCFLLRVKKSYDLHAACQ
jgi:hypothetical protein